MALAEIGARLRLQGAERFRRDAERAGDAVDRLGDEAADADRQLGRMGRAAAKAKGGFDKMSGAMGGVAGLAAGIAGGAVFSFVKDSVMLASDLGETMSKTQVIFGDAFPEMVAFAETAARSIGATKQEALDGLSSIGSLFGAFGVGGADAAKMSQSLVTLAGDLGSFNNASTGDAIEALSSALKGESDPIQAFSINLSAAAVEAEAMSSGLVKMEVDSVKLKSAQLALLDAQAKSVKVNKSVKSSDLDRAKAANAVKKSEEAVKKALGGKKVELTAAQKAQATYNLIMKQSKPAQGDFARTSEGLANSTKIMQAEFTNLKTELGTKLLPLVVAGMKHFSRFIDQFKKGEGAGGEFRRTVKDVTGALRENWPLIKQAGKQLWDLGVVLLKHVLPHLLRLRQMKLDQITGAFSALKGAVVLMAEVGLGAMDKFLGMIGTVAGVLARIPGPQQAIFKSVAETARQGQADIQRLKDSLNGLDGKTVRAQVLVDIATQTARGNAPAGIGGVMTPDARAVGGPVQASKPYLVGERGPELVVPNISGRVIPAQRTAQLVGSGGGGTVVHEHHHYLDGKAIKASVVTRIRDEAARR